MVGLCTALFAGASTTPVEKNIITSVRQNNSNAIALLEKLVNINSGTENAEGVYHVGNLLEPEFSSLGFTAKWVHLPAEMSHAGTLFFTRKGNQGKHLLLIVHMDTVYAKDAKSSSFSRQGELAYGPGIIDDKGGIVVLLYALKALHAQGALNNTRITIALVGDEESPGKPVAVARSALLSAAKDVDVALDFEPGPDLDAAVIARRGSSHWQLVSYGKETHSSLLFKEDTGFGAIFEISRVLDQVQRIISAEKYANFNPGVMVGGNKADIDKLTSQASGQGKNNIVAAVARAQGNMRYIDNAQRDRMKKAVVQITKNALPGTSSVINFQDVLPPMPATPGNEQLLSLYSKVSTDLGYSPMHAVPPDLAGGADINHVAAFVPANLSRLGVVGSGEHTANEILNIPSLTINTERAALLIYRLTH